jgi:hypothetical protein
MTRFVIVLLVALLTVPRSLFAGPCNTLTAKQLDDYLAAHDSPLAGLGQHLIDVGDLYDIDPRLLIAIAQQETSLGTAGDCSAHHNPFNWFYCIRCMTTCTPCAASAPASLKCPLSAYDSWADSVGSVGHWLSAHYLDHGLETIAEIGAKYCAQGCANWAKNVEQILKALGGDPKHLRFKCRCGNGVREGGEQCDGTDSAECPAGCRSDCTCPCGPHECWDPFVNGCCDVVCNFFGCGADMAEIASVYVCETGGVTPCGQCDQFCATFPAPVHVVAPGTGEICPGDPSACGCYSGRISCVFAAP